MVTIHNIIWPDNNVIYTVTVPFGDRTFAEWTKCFLFISSVINNFSDAKTICNKKYFGPI